MKKSNPFFKIIIFAILTSSVLFFSCSTEIEQKQLDAVATNAMLKSNSESPEHTLNIYDHVGELHNEILSVFYTTAQQPQNTVDILERLDSIAQDNQDFVTLSGHDYVAPDLAKVDYILLHKITCATNVISSSNLSVDAKTRLSNFISAVLAYSNSDDSYGAVYTFIVDYELEIINSTALDARDKEVLLTLSSIARYSLYAKKKRPKKNMDPDWDILVSNIIGSAEGVDDGAATAVMYALVAGIAEN